MFLARKEEAVTTVEKGSLSPKGGETTSQWPEKVQSWQHSVFHAEKRAYTLSGKSPGLQLQANHATRYVDPAFPKLSPQWLLGPAR